MVSSSKTTLVLLALLLACNVLQALVVKLVPVLILYKPANGKESDRPIILISKVDTL
jgi:hypothetical protein